MQGVYGKILHKRMRTLLWKVRKSDDARQNYLLHHDFRPGLQLVQDSFQLRDLGPAARHLLRFQDGSLALGLQKIDQGVVLVAAPAVVFVEEPHAGQGADGLH